MKGVSIHTPIVTNENLRWYWDIAVKSPRRTWLGHASHLEELVRAPAALCLVQLLAKGPGEAAQAEHRVENPGGIPGRWLPRGSILCIAVIWKVKQ